MVRAPEAHGTLGLLIVTPQAGIEPATYWLTASRSTTELLRHGLYFNPETNNKHSHLYCLKNGNGSARFITFAYM